MAGSTVHCTFRIEPEKRDELDKMAQSMDRDRTWLINEAINRYLELLHFQDQLVEEGLAAANAGQFVSHAEVGRRIEQWSKKQRKKSITKAAR